MSEDIFKRHNLGKFSTGIWWEHAEDAAKYPSMHKTVTHTHKKTRITWPKMSIVLKVIILALDDRNLNFN